MGTGKLFVNDSIVKALGLNLVGMKLYNAESLYEFAADNNILLMSPQKKNVHKGFYRKKMLKSFRKKTYNRRQLVEAGFSSIKRKFGTYISSKNVRSIRTDVYGRLACHNLFSFWLSRLLGQSRRAGKTYISVLINASYAMHKH